MGSPLHMNVIFLFIFLCSFALHCNIVCSMELAKRHNNIGELNYPNYVLVKEQYHYLLLSVHEPCALCIYQNTHIYIYMHTYTPKSIHPRLWSCQTGCHFASRTAIIIWKLFFFLVALPKGHINK